MNDISFISFRVFNQELTIFGTHNKIMFVEDGMVQGDEDHQPVELLIKAKKQLIEYFDMERKTFDLAYDLDSLTEFQRAVSVEIMEIPYGETRSYKDIAIELGTSPRAVGNACGRNPIPFFIPCHRVIKSNGSLGGFKRGNAQGDLDIKSNLLKLEQSNI